jgi:hypothetical protein
MSEPIKVGDLVQIVRECCEPGTVRGRIGRVLEISGGRFECEDCLWRTTRPQARIDGLASAADTLTDTLGWVPVAWLQRIPDFPELADERHDEEITA